MSISHLLVPNNYNIFVGSITPSDGPLPVDGKLTITNNTPDGSANIHINQTDITTSANDIRFSNNGADIFYVGENPTNNDSYVWAEFDFKIGTNFMERLRIPQAGIALDNTATSILAQQGTTLVSKNNVIDTSSVQTLTNKTINSSLNTIIAGAVSGTPNLNTVLNQNVSTTATPIFQGLALNNSLTLSSTRLPVRGSIPANTTVTMYSLVLPVGQSIVISFTLSANCLTGANTGYSDLIYDYKLVNDGTITGSAGNSGLISEANLTGAYTGKLTPNIGVSGGTTVVVELISTLATGAITYGGFIDVCYA